MNYNQLELTRNLRILLDLHSQLHWKLYKLQIASAMMLIRHKDPLSLKQGREALLKIQNPLSDE